MPELPEVETIKRQLKIALINKIIKNILVNREKSFIGKPQNFYGKKITAIKRKAKVLIIKLENPSQSPLKKGRYFPLLLIHLKMTGQIIYQVLSIKDKELSKKDRIIGGHPTDDVFGKLPHKHTRVIIEFTDNSKLYFNDIRTFGWIKEINNEQEFDKETRNFSGIEPLSKEFAWQNLKQKLGKINRPIKLAILDQTKIAGIGNIYANDGLFLARIMPTKKANLLTDLEWQELTKSLITVLQKSIKLGGTSQSTYVQTDGSKGNYQDHFLVYKKEDQPCPKCDTKIIKTKIGGRGTFYCPKCQK